MPPLIGNTLHSWLKSSALKPSFANFACLESVSEVSVIAGGLSISVKAPRVVVTEDKPTKTKLLPVIRTTFLPAPISKEPVVAKGFDLLSVTVPSVFPPTATAAVPAPTITSNFPDVVIEAVHLPVHFNAPVPNDAGAGLHLPVREDFEAEIKLFEILKSPL